MAHRILVKKIKKLSSMELLTLEAVLQLENQGEICKRMGISVNNYRNKHTRILTKLQQNSLSGAVMRALELGMIGMIGE